MMFDTLAGIVERHLPQFKPMLEQAKIFRIESTSSHKNAEQAVESWEPDERTIENFRLPFKVVAIEHARDRYSSDGKCVLLSFQDETIRRMSVLAASRHGQETYVASCVCDAFADDADMNSDGICAVKSMSMWRGDRQGIRPADCDMSKVDSGFKTKRPESNFEKVMKRVVDGELSMEEAVVQLGDRVEALAELKKRVGELHANIIASSVSAGVLSVLVINEPACFIVEEKPVTTKECKLDIRRSASRPHFIVLKPRQIRERFIYANGRAGDKPDDDEGCKVTPHERRGHHRRLQSSRFVKAKGLTIWIKPMWVGPSEAVVGGNRYKVRLDL